MIERSPAWLLKAAPDVTCAVAQHEMMEFIDDPDAQRVPLANPYCRHLLLWRERLLPIVDVACLLSGVSPVARCAVSVVAYQAAARQPLEYLGIWVDAAPGKVEVSDDQACDLPDAWLDPRFQRLALSCFAHEGRTVPILKLADLATFTDSGRSTAQQIAASV